MRTLNTQSYHTVNLKKEDIFDCDIKSNLKKKSDVLLNSSVKDLHSYTKQEQEGATQCELLQNVPK